jgi:hypothetical protein
VATVASDDERLARDLQAQEGVVTGQLVGRVVGHGTHGAPIPTNGRDFDVPAVVMGHPVSSGSIPPSQRANLPQGVPVEGLPPGLEDILMGAGITYEELVVLNYRTSVKCFAMLDAILNCMQVTQLPFVFTIVLIGGPLCGFFGADRLRQGSVTVYLAYCILKTLLFLAGATVYPLFILMMLVQMWITKIVFEFWHCLGTIPELRKQQLLNAEVPVQMTYW